jgi:hypothetical protein
MNSTNIIGISFDAIAQGRIDQLKSAMDAIIAAELQFVVPTIKALLVMFVVRQFTLTWTGNMTVERFVGSSVRAAVVVFLISHSGAFVQYVRDPIFDKIPQAISSTILSASGMQTTSTATIAQQFDKASAASDAVTAKIVKSQTAWAVASAVNYLSAQLANGGIQFLLACICGVWLLGQSLLAIILCFGPLALGFELFDRTRGWLDQWIGKLVGMTCFGVGTSILLGIQMRGLLDLLHTVDSSVPANGAQAVAVLMRVAGNVGIDLLTMGALPAICAYGSGVAASLAAPSAIAAMRGGAAAGSAARAAAALARRGPGTTPTNSMRNR